MACLMAAMVSNSTSPLNAQARVRPCTAKDWMPASAAKRAIATPLRSSGELPVRILRVTGTSTAATTACKMSATSLGCSSKADPAAFLHTFLAGQPILISIIWAPKATLAWAAAAICMGSLPAICTLIGALSSAWGRRS